MKKLYGVLAALSGMVTLGAVGSLETGTIGNMQGTIIMYGALVAFVVFAKLAGAFEPYVYKESRPGVRDRKAARRKDQSDYIRPVVR